MRPIWNGMISFGLVNIPVGLYSATEEQDVALHFLHAKDHGRVRNQRICEVDGEPVEYSDLVRAFEYEKDKYVELTDEELDKIKIEASDRIVIDDFVDQSEIEFKYFEKPYYLLPEKNSNASYGLFREALIQSKKVGIARIVIRTKERLAAVRADGPVIMLDTMHFADEIRKIDAPAAVTTGKRELDMALTLINAMTNKFDPSKYKDTYKEALMAAINQKLEGKQVVQEQGHTAPTEVIDLMAYLKKSIEQAEANTSKPHTPPPSSRKRKSASSAEN